MFRFAHPEYLYLLVLVPLLVVLNIYMAARRRKSLERFGQMETISQLMPDVSFVRPIVKFYFLLTSFAIIIFALAGPQFGSKLETVKRKGIELVIALDVSNSMNAADIEPTRLERAKQGISRLVDRLEGDRVGVVIFAGQAYTQLPITADASAAKMFVSNITTGSVPSQGTDISAAIKLSMKSFSKKEGINRAIIVVTDGEDHEAAAVEAAKEAVANGVRVITVGMGLPKGSPIRIPGGGETDFMKDKEGNVVITKLNESMLQEIAAAGSGVYIPANNLRNGIENLLDTLSKLEKSEMESKVYSEYDEQFQYLAAIVLLLLIIDATILERKNRFLKHIKLFDSTKEVK